MPDTPPEMFSCLESLEFPGMHLLNLQIYYPYAVENDCHLEILLLCTFVLNLFPSKMVFHLRLVIWTTICSQGGSFISFSPLSCSGILCPLCQICLTFISCIARSGSHCLQLHTLRWIKYQIFWLNHSNSSTVFLLPYRFLMLIAIEQIFTNAGNWEDMTLHEYKCIPLVRCTKCFLFKVKEKKNAYWLLTVCQDLYEMFYMFISI